MRDNVQVEKGVLIWATSDSIRKPRPAYICVETARKWVSRCLFLVRIRMQEMTSTGIPTANGRGSKKKKEAGC